jgi:hypothetical protein
MTVKADWAEQPKTESGNPQGVDGGIDCRTSVGFRIAGRC